MVKEEAIFLTGFHIHPKHSVNYLHMHVICTNNNMKNNGPFEKHTSSEKFIATEDMLEILNDDGKNVKVNMMNEMRKKVNMKLKQTIQGRNGVMIDAKNRMRYGFGAGVKNENNKYYEKLANGNMNKFIRNPANIVHMDKKCVIFSNRDSTYRNKNGSCSKIHLLVIPWKPIYNCVELEEKDVRLVKHMDMMGVMCGKEIAKYYENIGEASNYDKHEAIKSWKAGNKMFKQMMRVTQLKKSRQEMNVKNYNVFTEYAPARFKKMKAYREMLGERKKRKEENNNEVVMESPNLNERVIIEEIMKKMNMHKKGLKETR